MDHDFDLHTPVAGKSDVRVEENDGAGRNGHAEIASVYRSRHAYRLPMFNKIKVSLNKNLVCRNKGLKSL